MHFLTGVCRRWGGGAWPDQLGRVGAQVERELLGSVRIRQQRAAGVEARRIRLDVTALAGLGDRLIDTGHGGLGALTCGEDVELGALLVRQVVDRQAAADVETERESCSERVCQYV